MILGQVGPLGVFGVSSWQGYIGYMVEIEGVINLGNYRATMQCDDPILLYQHSDNVLRVPIIDSVYRMPIPPSSFSQAEYVLTDEYGETQIRLALNKGITIDDDGFRIFIDDGLIDSEFIGTMTHQFVLWNEVGDKLPPIFKGKVKVCSVIL